LPSEAGSGYFCTSGICCASWQDAILVDHEELDSLRDQALRLVYTGGAMNAVSIRGDWVGQVIGGKFPLIQWLGGSSTCGVFVSELPAGDLPSGTQGSQRVTIKLIPATAAAEEHLLMWKRAASHRTPTLSEF
jgi:hypothetical protein